MAASDRTTIWMGVFSSAMGTLLLLMALGVITPDQPSNGDTAPLWIPGLAGLMFFLAGIVVVLRTVVRGASGPDGGLPSNAPLWLRALYDLMGVVIGIGLTAIATWVAFGPGERHFSGFSTFGSFAVGETFGRTVFGIGAVMMWGIMLAITVSCVRSLFSRTQPKN